MSGSLYLRIDSILLYITRLGVLYHSYTVASYQKKAKAIKRPCCCFGMSPGFCQLNRNKYIKQWYKFSPLIEHIKGHRIT